MTVLKLVTEDCDNDTIEVLEELLNRAKSGEIINIACAYVFKDGSTGSKRSDTNCSAIMMGAIEVLKHRFVEDWLS